MIVKVTKSPWWFVAYLACCAGMVTCAIWADGDPAWLAWILIPVGAVLLIVALLIAKRIFRD